MLVEITGALGSGKSTLVGMLAARLTAEGMPSVVMRAGGRLSADPATVPWALPFAARHWPLCRLLVRATNRDADSWRTRSVLLWNIMRKAGMHERLGRRSLADVVLWDEGLVHMAHNAFAHIRRPPREGEVLEFGELVPKPDMVVLVRAPADVAHERILARGHKRTAGDSAAVRALLSNADRVFDILTRLEAIRERALEVHNATADQEDIHQHVERIVTAIRLGQSAGRP